MILNLAFGFPVDLTQPATSHAPAKLWRAFEMVNPANWGRGDWREQVRAALEPSDLEAAGVTLGDVCEAVEFFTATPATVHIGRDVKTDNEIYTVRADGYRRGPAS